MTRPDAVRLGIAWRRSARLFALAKAAIGLIALAILAGFAAEASDRISNGSDDLVKDVAIVGFTGLGGLASFLVFLSAGAAAMSKNPHIEVAGDHLRIRHRGLFRDDVTIDRGDVRAVWFDDRSKRRFRKGRQERFEIPDGNEPLTEGWPRWLYSRSAGSPFPVLGRPSDLPNTAISFERPLPVGPARRWVKIFPARSSIHPPIHGRRSRGLLVRLTDPDAARRVFDSWGVVRPIDADDLFEVRPTDTDRKKVRFLARLDGVAIGALLFALLGLPVLLQDPATGSFLIPARGVCRAIDGARTPSSGVMRLPDVAVMDNLLPDDPADKGYVALDGAGFRGDLDQHQFGAVLDDANLDNAYGTRWGRPNFALYAEVYDTGTPRSAGDLNAALIGLACVDASETFEVSGVPGAVGMRWPAQEGIADMAFFSRDEYVFWVVVVESGEISGITELIEVVRDIDAELERLSARTADAT